jgi:steroid delta-isomerase-like uncharacterized protein
VPQAAVDAARALVEAYNDGDWRRLEGLLSPDCLYDEVATGTQTTGAPEFAAHWQGWKRAMPDAIGTVTNELDCGSTAIIEVTWKGTFTGPWATPEGEVEPTGKQQTTRACIVATVQDGTVKQCRQYFDSMALMTQLGLLATPATA